MNGFRTLFSNRIVTHQALFRIAMVTTLGCGAAVIANARDIDFGIARGFGREVRDPAVRAGNDLRCRAERAGSRGAATAGGGGVAKSNGGPQPSSAQKVNSTPVAPKSSPTSLQISDPVRRISDLLAYERSKPNNTPIGPKSSPVSPPMSAPARNFSNFLAAQQKGPSGTNIAAKPDHSGVRTGQGPNPGATGSRATASNRSAAATHSVGSLSMPGMADEGVYQDYFDPLGGLLFRGGSLVGGVDVRPLQGLIVLGPLSRRIRDLLTLSTESSTPAPMSNFPNWPEFPAGTQPWAPTIPPLRSSPPQGLTPGKSWRSWQ